MSEQNNERDPLPMRIVSVCGDEAIVAIGAAIGDEVGGAPSSDGDAVSIRGAFCLDADGNERLVEGGDDALFGLAMMVAWDWLFDPRPAGGLRAEAQRVIDERMWGSEGRG